MNSLDIIEFAVVALLILGLVYIILKLGKYMLKVVLGIVVNSILGFIAIFLLNYLFALDLPFTLPIIISTAVFGLPAVGTLVILKLTGALVATA